MKLKNAADDDPVQPKRLTRMLSEINLQFFFENVQKWSPLKPYGWHRFIIKC